MIEILSEKILKLFMMKKNLLLSIFVFFLFQSVAVYAVVPVKENTVPQSAITESVSQFNQLSKKEKKQRVTEVKKQLKLFKQNQREGKASDENTILLVILSIILPPLAVYLYQDAITSKFWIDLLLTILFWVPGVIFALLVVLGVI